MDELRKKAVELLTLARQNISEMSDIEIQKLIEELQVHQIELQIQNEELRAGRLELEKARSRYFNLFDLAPVGYLVINEKGVIKELNLKASEIFQRRKEHLVNHPFASLLNQVSMSAFYEFFEHAQRQYPPENLEVIIGNKGDVCYIELSVSKYIDGDYLLILSETTDKKMAELNLKNSELQLRVITDNIPVFISYIDNQSRFMFVNKKYEEFYGIQRENIIGKHVQELLSPDSYLKSEPFIKKVQAGQEVRFEIETRTRENKPLTFDVILIPDRFRNQIIGYFSIFHDITERKIFEEKIIKAKNLHLKILDDFPTPIWQSGPDKLCYFFNKTWLGFTGRTLEQEYGNGWTQGVHPDDICQCMETYSNAFDQRMPFEMEYRLRDKNGNYRWVIDIGRPFFELDDQFAGYIGSCYDITENKEAHNELKELNATREKLFSIIAHDLKSPFTSILGFSDLLGKNIKNYDISKSEKFAGHINSAAKTTLNLLDNLLDWAKAQTGKIKFKPERIQISNSLVHILEILHPSAEIKNIKINLDETEDIFVCADPDMLQTIIRNLLSNAIKYTNFGGKISITIAKDHEYALIRITDNGIGMSPNTLENIFKIDEKSSIPGTANERGSGLGLLLCHEFVEKQGGRIWAESELGKGSMFCFTLPLIDP